MIRIGVLTPHAAIGPEEELPAMAPGRVVARVVRITTDAAPAQPPALRALTIPQVLDHAAGMLAEDSVDVVGYASTTTAYVVGFEEEAAIAARVSALLDVPAAATCASAVLALRVLRAERVALIGAPWFEPELNKLGAAYFRGQGFDVVSSMSADLSHDPRRIDGDAVYAWVSQHVLDDAQAVFIGGNGFRAVRAIERLETALGRPVLTANQVLLWNLLVQAGAPVEIRGYGALFAHESPG
jgi:maleate isomerase